MEWYDAWHKLYTSKKYIEIKKHLNEKKIENLNKLGIEIKEKTVTQREFEVIEGELFRYDNSDIEELSDDEKQYLKSLDKTGVNKEEYNHLLGKFEYIRNNYVSGNLELEAKKLVENKNK